MLSVIQFDKSIYPMVIYENYLISIFMNVYVNLQKICNIKKTTINLEEGGGGDWQLDLPCAPWKVIFSCMTKCLVGPPEYKKILSKI